MEGIPAIFASFAPSASEARSEKEPVRPVLDLLGRDYELHELPRRRVRLPYRPRSHEERDYGGVEAFGDHGALFEISEEMAAARHGDEPEGPTATTSSRTSGGSSPGVGPR